MLSALVFSTDAAIAPPLGEDLRAVGVRVVAAQGSDQFVQAAMKIAPDLIVCFEPNPDTAFFERVAKLQDLDPRPVIVFTIDPDADKIALATRSGVQAYVVDGYGQNRLRSVIHLALARFRQERLLRTELAEVRDRFAERKLVDRAKGILMGARRLREEEAFRALRSAAMASKQRIGQVSRLVIDSARYAEAVNRAGQLRMLSQRLVSLSAFSCAPQPPAEAKGLLADALAHVEANMATLQQIVSQPTYGDLLGAVTASWGRLRPLLLPSVRRERLQDLDRHAETLLEQADQLTANLEVAAYATALHAINVAGRQRMLSQRVVKGTLVGVVAPGAAASRASEVEVAREGFLAGLDFLRALPLSNEGIARELAAASEMWAALDPALSEVGTTAGRARIFDLSERLLDHCDRLTDEIERGMQVFVGAAHLPPLARAP